MLIFSKTALLCIHGDVVGVGTGTEKSLLLPATPWHCTGNKTVVQWICIQIQTPLNSVWFQVSKSIL